MTKPRSYDFTFTVTGKFNLSVDDQVSLTKQFNHLLEQAREYTGKDPDILSVKFFDKNVLKGADVDDYNFDQVFEFVMKRGLKTSGPAEEFRKDLTGMQVVISTKPRGKSAGAADE